MELNNHDLSIGLNLIPGVGSVLSKRLLDGFSSPDELIDASPRKLRWVEGIGEKMAANIAAFSWESEIKKEKEMARRAEARIVTFMDTEYPDSLKSIYDPPQVLYIKGKIKPEDMVAISVVGSRVPTTYGKIMAEKLSRDLTERGITVVSGLARGIDSVAHRTTIEAGGRTLAILGCGINVVYPPENRGLYREIIKNGALISEFSMDVKPDRMNFPRRNRLISAFSIGTLVVEAAEKSGALITAHFALEQGKEVFAVPGPASSRKSRGTNRLIKSGAKLVEDIEDVIEELSYEIRSFLKEPRVKAKGYPSTDTMDGNEQKVYSAITDEEIHIDDIVNSLHLPPGMVSAILLKLEIKGLVNQFTGQYYMKRM